MTETVQGFYSMLTQVWRDGVLDISVTRLMLALGVFMFFTVLRGLFTRFVLRRLKRVKIAASQLDRNPASHCLRQ